MIGLILCSFRLMKDGLILLLLSAIHHALLNFLYILGMNLLLLSAIYGRQ
jgi:hypothetical protein